MHPREGTHLPQVCSRLRWDGVVERLRLLEAVRSEFEYWFCHLIDVTYVKLPKLSDPQFPQSGVADTYFMGWLGNTGDHLCKIVWRGAMCWFPLNFALKKLSVPPKNPLHPTPLPSKPQLALMLLYLVGHLCSITLYSIACCYRINF